METERVSTGRAAELLGMARQSVLRAIKRGDLEAETIQGDGRTHYSVALTDLKAFQRRREAKILNAPINQPAPVERPAPTGSGSKPAEALA
ncbi:hypothetical protein [Nesterenkonia rhizosphaerae]|uniref:Helix-turn-helix domain-containing protein n=1 Tax=Nesterenkonia rhizosphaerae TaxID=1348272 RepID=A0ABP9FZG0_9MICC